MDPVQHEYTSIAISWYKVMGLGYQVYAVAFSKLTVGTINSVSFSRADVSASSVTDCSVDISGSLWDVVSSLVVKHQVTTRLISSSRLAGIIWPRHIQTETIKTLEMGSHFRRIIIFAWTYLMVSQCQGASLNVRRLVFHTKNIY